MARYNMLRLLFLGALVLTVRAASDTGIGVVIRPTKLWRIFHGDEDTVMQRAREDYQEFSVGVIRCLRYCVKSETLTDESLDVLQLTWKLGLNSSLIFEKDFLPQILQKGSIKSNGSEDMQNKCTFSVTIGCTTMKENKSSLGDEERKFIKSLQPSDDITKVLDDKDPPALNFLHERLVHKDNLINETEVNFIVQPARQEMNIMIFGNVTDLDVKIPLGGGLATAPPQLTLATTRMPGGASGVRLNINEPPPGGWSLRLQGLRQQKYRLVVLVNDALPKFVTPEDMDSFVDESILLDGAEARSELRNLTAPYRQDKSLDQNVDRMDEGVLSDSLETDKQVLPRQMFDSVSLNEQKKAKSFQFPATKNDIVNANHNSTITVRMDAEDDELQTRVIDRSFVELSDLNNPLNEDLPIRKYLTVELNSRTELFAHPGTYHRLTFDITNNHILRIKHLLFPSSSPFPVFQIPAPFVILDPGQTISFPVDIVVPPQVGDAVNKVTLRVEGIEIVEKSANFYVRTSPSRVFDDRRPDIRYYFNNNCHGSTSAENCLKTFWSVDVLVQDVDSGIKSVVSVPKGIYARTPYVSGSSTPVYFYYSNNCCNRVMEVTATDASGNVYTRKIDVDEWTNLTTGEILAIIFIILFIILLIVLIVLSIVYCYKRKKSLDLPYSQRYGSRSSPQ